MDQNKRKKRRTKISFVQLYMYIPDSKNLCPTVQEDTLPCDSNTRSLKIKSSISRDSSCQKPNPSIYLRSNTTQGIAPGTTNARNIRENATPTGACLHYILKPYRKQATGGIINHMYLNYNRSNRACGAQHTSVRCRVVTHS